jgi:hypothetical protein
MENSMRRPSLIAPLALSAFCLILGGCPSGDERPNSSTSNYLEDRGHVFSDDDAAIAFVEYSYDVTTSGVAPYQSRVYSNRAYQLKVANASGADVKSVGPQVDGQAPTKLFFMRSAGYVLAFETTDAAYVVKKLDLDSGAMTEITRDGTTPCDGNIFNAIPSPQGDIIAITRWDETSGCAEGEEIRVSVELLDAVDGELLAPKTTLAFDNMTLRFTWRGDEAFVVSDLSKSVEVSEDGVVEDVRQPGCFYPQTTSSEIAANGTAVSFENGTIALGSADRPGFGCQ